MISTLKKMYLAITAMLIAVTAQVNGADCYQPYDCKPQCCTESCRELYFTGELLYLRPALCGLESAFGDTTISTTVAGGIITTTTIEKDVEPHSRWRPGFRVGAGALYNCFDLNVEWTDYHGRADFSDGNQSGNWKIKYDVVDLTLGRFWNVSRCFTFKPYIGVRGTIIRQSLNSHLETLFTSIVGDSTVLTDKDDKEHFWGVGPLLGLKAAWDLGCDFSLYGNVDVVSYYGEVKGENNNVDTFTSTVSVCDGHVHRCFNTIGTDVALGVRWDRCICFCGCKANLFFNLGVEQHRIYDFSNLGSDGNLSLDGGVFGAGISFCY